jgi:2-polyprenyl-3-methyl-5-hydroxy-6-metoxy-1,4-benzoquinol methylase
MSNYKKTELETLATFQEEIPSQYFSHKGQDEFDTYMKKMEYLYRMRFKFPPKMFDGVELIDFGAGTGENTIYLANWGAKCTLVEMNDKAQKISKEVFSKYAKKPEDHTFVHSSIFEYKPSEKKKYDIVHCRGVLSHTSEKEEAFRIISEYVKPGGYIIFGDPNKAGGFQNMLQRYAVYSFGSTPDAMVDVSELLFKEDIDRSQEAVPRTRRAIIFDRWVIQQQDDPSVAEVNSWMANSGLQMYSSYPEVLMPIMSDSYLDNKIIDPYAYQNLFTIPELAWMMRTDDDSNFLPEVDKNMEAFTTVFSEITSFIANFSKKTKVNTSEFNKKMEVLVDASSVNQFLNPLEKKMSVFSKEVVGFVKVVQDGDLSKVRAFIENTEFLFKGAVGVRHVDFIGHKPIKG